MAKRDHEDRDKDRHWRREQNEHAQIHVPGESAVASKRAAAHRTLSKRRVCKDKPANHHSEGENADAKKALRSH
jgi:hypothetical protein